MRRRGYSMAFYAAFLAAVGLPLLALCVDVSRIWAAQTKLRNAVEAACAAYANSVDISAFIRSGTIEFAPDAGAYAARVFRAGAPEGAELGIGARDGEDGVTLVDCRGRGTVPPLIQIGVSGYSLRHETTAKSKFGEIENWK